MRTRSQREEELVSLPVTEIMAQHAQAMAHYPQTSGKPVFPCQNLPETGLGQMIREILEREFPALPPGRSSSRIDNSRLSKTA
jgi:hypothetical protein